jgi:hypothetical protein
VCACARGRCRLLYTTLSGAFSAAVRQVYAVLLNLLVLLRPDLRIFPLFATLGVVHGAYLAALYVDHAHTNPVLRAAVEVWVRGAALRAGRAAAKGGCKAVAAVADADADADADAMHVLARNGPRSRPQKRARARAKHLFVR